MRNLSRSTALKLAGALTFLISAYSVIASIPDIFQGAAVVNQSPDSPPFIIALIGLITGVVGLVAAYGTWKQQRWGIILAILANLVNGLSAAPGLLFAPTAGLRVAATVTVLLSVVIIVLCLWRDRKPVLA